jgi:hypothetical protein
MKFNKIIKKALALFTAALMTSALALPDAVAVGTLTLTSGSEVFVENASSPVPVFSGADITGSVSFAEGYVDIRADGGGDSTDVLSVVSGSGLTVSGTQILRESDNKLLGSIDSTYDGSDGYLRINFNSPLENSGFEDGTGTAGKSITQNMRSAATRRERTATRRRSKPAEAAAAAITCI